MASSRLRPYPGRGGRSRIGIAPLGMFPLRKQREVRLKGLSHEIEFKNVDKNYIILGLNKDASWSLNFQEAPFIFK